jgi:uncharacterized membrane protein YdcZ (DUF606 family)
MKNPFGIYLIFIILIILFPPMDWHQSSKIVFDGWSFITGLGGSVKINVIYFLVEIGIVTLVYFIYLQSKKK